MSYLHIPNLYRSQLILMMRECYALEKCHGTSAHISYLSSPNGDLTFSSGGESATNFRNLFNEESLIKGFQALGQPEVIVYGEAYGGKQQGMKATYGPELKFIVFDIKFGDIWLSVPEMDQVATSLGLEVVPYHKVTTDLAAIDAERDRPSEIAVRRGITEPKQREGVVLRPLVELMTPDGERVITKHKIEKFSERATPQKVISPDKLLVLKEAEAVAMEWTTPMRLEHVLQKHPGVQQMEHVPELIAAMVEDVYREAKGEIVESKEAAAAIGKRTVKLFKDRMNAQLRESHS